MSSEYLKGTVEDRRRMSIFAAKSVICDVVESYGTVPRSGQHVLVRVLTEFNRLDAIRAHRLQLKLIGTFVGRH